MTDKTDTDNRRKTANRRLALVLLAVALGFYLTWIVKTLLQ